jgi:hypothetical protein
MGHAEEEALLNEITIFASTNKEGCKGSNEQY